MLDAPQAARFIPAWRSRCSSSRLGAMPERVLTRSMRFRAVGLSAAIGEIVYACTARRPRRARLGRRLDHHREHRAVDASSVALLIRAAGVSEWATPTRLRADAVQGHDAVRPAARDPGHRAQRRALLGQPRRSRTCSAQRATGLYNLAYNLADIPAIYIGEQLALVLLPSMASLPPERRPRALERSTALLSLIIFPLAVGLGLVADPLIALVLSRRVASRSRRC